MAGPSGEEQIDILVNVLNADQSKKEIDDTTNHVRQRIQEIRDIADKIGKVPPLPASFVIGGLNEINKMIDGVTSKSSIEKLTGFDKFNKQISGMDITALTNLRNEIIKTVDAIAEVKTPDFVKIKPLEELEQKFNLVNEAIKDYWDTQKSETSGTGGKLEQFLGRYKYSLLLIGGAIGAIVGMVKYSSVFGTTLDLIGQAIGYIGDVLLFPVLPLVMDFVGWLIGVGDYINGLPDSVRTLISSFLGFAILGYLFKGPIGFVIGLIKDLINWLWKLAAISKATGVLTGTGFAVGLLGGLLLGFAVADIMMQSGFDNWLATIGNESKKAQPLITGMVSTMALPFGMLGVIINDLLSGQVDQIPNHIMNVLGQVVAGVMVMVYHVLKAWAMMAKGIGDTWKWVGELIKSNPVTAEIGDAMIKQVDKVNVSINKNLENVNSTLTEWEDMQKALGLMAQYGGFQSPVDNKIYLPFGRSEESGEPFNIPYTHGMEVPKDQYLFSKPGSYVNGWTSEDQKRALYGQDSQAQIDEWVKSLNDSATYTGTNYDYSKVTDQIYTKSEELTEAYKKYSDAIDAYNEAVKGGHPELYTPKQIEYLNNNVNLAKKNIDDITESMFNLDQVTNQTTDSLKAVSEAASGDMTSGLQKFLSSKAPEGINKMLQSDRDRWTELYNSSRSLQERFGDISSSQAYTTAAINPPEMETAISDMTAPIPDVIEKTVTVQVKPEYVWMSHDIPSVLNAAKPSVQEISQQFTWVGHAGPDVATSIAQKVPDMASAITEQSVTVPVKIIPEYEIQDVAVPDMTSKISEQVAAQPVTVEVDAAKNQITDMVTSVASSITQAFSTSAGSIGTAFIDMINNVQQEFTNLESAIRSTLAAGSPKISPMVNVSSPAGAQPNITYRDTYYNYYTLPQKTDVRQLAEEVSKILQKGANRLRK